MKLLPLLFLLALVLAAPVAAQAPSFQDLEESLTCQCGCGLTVHACNHLQCGSALPLRREIREQMALGKSKNAILAYFSGKYGEKILSAPTTTGFNLTAWVMPFAMLALGALFVMATLWRWTHRTRQVTAADPAAARSAATSAHERILERELRSFDE